MPLLSSLRHGWRCVFTSVIFLSIGAAQLTAAGLANSPSAFLRDHAAAPVHWMPWGDEAFARAKAEAKPVFLAVGFASNELTRAMHEQSFSGADVSAFLNDNFICVLVDRDERPDVSALCQAYVREAKQLSGWPVNLWLTPELQPIDGATYLPPSEEWGKEGFFNAAKRIATAWKSDPAAQRRNAAEAVATVLSNVRRAPPPPLPDAAAMRALLSSATKAWMETFDAAHPGFGDAPRYPEPELLRFLLHEDGPSRDAALATLRAMAAGALRDPLDGGFFRYAIDAAWHVPTLQKSAADQARLALAYLDAARVSGDASLENVARGALDYALSRLALSDGGFASSEDASVAETAGFYAWTEKEIRSALGDDADEFIRSHGVLPEGNLSSNDDPDGRWKGKNILAGPPVASDAIVAARAKLLALRQARKPAPVIHENNTAGVDGAMLAALARAGAQCKESRYLDAARRVAGFIRDHLVDAANNRLHALGGSDAPAGPGEYAQVVAGLLELHAATNDAAWLALARHLRESGDALYFDAKTGRYFASSEPSPAGFWARVPVPSPLPGEPPSAGALALIAPVASHPEAGDSPERASAEILERAIIAEIKEGPAAARGDLLLALQSAQAGR